MQFDKQAALKELGVSEDMYDELLQIFIKQTEITLKNLEAVIKLEDFGQIAKSAHFINGSAANLRLEEIRALAKDIDAQAKGNKDIKIIEENIRKLKKEFEEVKIIALK